jgi:LCP family protein required for cell wall assembly
VALALAGLGAASCVLALLLLLSANRALMPALGDIQPLTLLILGVDRRADESGPSRSDSMILAGMNRETNQAALLSIPRDLWVAIPGVGEQRINTALVFGDDPTDPGAGPRLAVETVQRSLNLAVDRYLVLDFATFERLVDTLDGVEVDVPSPITDSEYPTPDYGITTIHFDPGLQVLDGQQALVYVRTRHSDGDFNRSQRQQQVIRSMAQRLVEPANWPRLPQLYTVLQEGVQTNLSPNDWPAVLQMVQAIAAGNVTTGTLDGDLTTPWITSGGAWVLLPNWPAIDGLLGRLFGPR